MSIFEQRVADQLFKRAEAGFKKYGVTMERNDLSFPQWLQHLQEELLDATVYIEKLKEEVVQLEALREEVLEYSKFKALKELISEENDTLNESN